MKRPRRPIGAWQTGAVTNMSEVFHYAIAFNQRDPCGDNFCIRDASTRL